MKVTVSLPPPRPRAVNADLLVGLTWGTGGNNSLGTYEILWFQNWHVTSSSLFPHQCICIMVNPFIFVVVISGVRKATVATNKLYISTERKRGRERVCGVDNNLINSAWRLWATRCGLHPLSSRIGSYVLFILTTISRHSPNTRYALL